MWDSLKDLSKKRKQAFDFAFWNFFVSVKWITGKNQLLETLWVSSTEYVSEDWPLKYELLL